MLKPSIVIAAALLSLATTAHAQHVVRVASSGDYPPFEVTSQDGKLAGFTIDVVTAVCENRSLSCEWQKLDFTGLIPALLAKKIDVIAGLTISEERKKRVLFTDSFYRSPVRFFGRKGGEFDVSSAVGFKGKTLGVESASIMQCYVDKVLPTVSRKAYRTQEEAYLDLVSGRVDVLINQAIQTQKNFLDKNPGYVFYGGDLEGKGCFGDGTGSALRPDDTDLRQTFSAGIAAIRANGTYATINAKYFPFDVYGN